MKRDPDKREIFTGIEVEKTALQGQSTIFFAGIFTYEEICSAYKNQAQIYLTANQSYHLWSEANCTYRLLNLIRLLMQTFPNTHIALDVPARYVEQFSLHLDEFPEVADSPKLIVQISAVASDSVSALKNLYIKVDKDISVGAPGIGVWTSKVEMTDKTFTAWGEYKGDKALQAPAQKTDAQMVAKPLLANPFNMNRTVVVHFMKRGVHCYPAAATDPGLATGDKYDVSYLATPHAHDFWFRVEVGITHNDRDIEFIQMRMILEDLYGDGQLQIGSRSCEMLAEELINQIVARWGQRYVKVSVFEDALQANGGTVEYNPKEQQ